MTAWVLFILGTIGYFVTRYANRKDKTTRPSLRYWWSDNWEQLLPALIFDLMLMIIFMNSDTDITAWLSKFLPDGFVVSSKLLGASLCGCGLGWTAYEVFKKKKNIEKP